MEACRDRLLAADHNAYLPPFVPVPDFHIGKVVRVYDGDTMTILVEINGVLTTLHVRVPGYDTPEIRSKVPSEKAAGKGVRDVVASRCHGKIVRIISPQKTDKYGRLLAEVETEDRLWSWGAFLAEHGLANAYDGKGKKQFTLEQLGAISEKCAKILA